MFGSAGRERKKLAERRLLKSWQACKYCNFSMEISSEWWASHLFQAHAKIFLSNYLWLRDNGWLLLLDGSCSALSGLTWSIPCYFITGPQTALPKTLTPQSFPFFSGLGLVDLLEYCHINAVRPDKIKYPLCIAFCLQKWADNSLLLQQIKPVNSLA